MNPVIDALSAFDAETMAVFLACTLGDPQHAVSVTYVQAGAIAINATAGSASATLTSIVVNAWRGVPLEQTDQAPDSETRQFIILAADLPGITPARGDFIRDDKGPVLATEFRIDRVEDGELAGTIYYLLHTTRLNP